MTKGKEVATTNAEMPDYLVKLQEEGNTTRSGNFDSSDVTIPQIKLLQGMSEQVGAFDGAVPGVFWHTGMDIPLGDDVKFVICSRRKKYLLQAPMDDGQGILARAEDALTWDRTGSWTVQVDKKTKAEWTINDLNVEASGLTDWGTYDPEDENSPPAATLFYEYLVLIVDHLELGPAVLSLARSAIKKAKKGLNDKIALHEGNNRPVQACVFSSGVVIEQNDANQDFYNWKFTGAGFAEQELFGMAVDFGNALSDYKVQDEGKEDREAEIKTDKI